MEKGLREYLANGLTIPESEIDVIVNKFLEKREQITQVGTTSQAEFSIRYSVTGIGVYRYLVIGDEEIFLNEDNLEFA
jgi:hypothetical protein